MILVTLWGGLGNQMFQYAAGLTLAARNRSCLKLDISYLTEQSQSEAIKSGHTPRAFELENFNISGTLASPHEIQKYLRAPRKRIAARIGVRIRRLTGVVLHYESPRSGYDPRFAELSPSAHLCISGRFRHHGYFDHIKERLKNEFRPFQISEGARKVIDEVRSSNSIGIHVRRGDYVTASVYSGIGAQTADYYEAALSYIRGIDRYAHSIFIFSDDIEWCRSNFQHINDINFVSHPNGGITAHDEFEIMKNCRHLVISNSTYSWWAAWLMQNKDGLTVAPNIWSNVPRLTADQLCPPSWVII